MQVTMNAGCMDVKANPRLTDREQVIQVVDLIVKESDGQIVVAAGTAADDEFECWFTLSWKEKWYTLEEAREIYTAAKKTILEKRK